MDKREERGHTFNNFSCYRDWVDFEYKVNSIVLYSHYFRVTSVDGSTRIFCSLYLPIQDGMTTTTQSVQQHKLNGAWMLEQGK